MKIKITKAKIEQFEEIFDLKKRSILASIDSLNNEYIKYLENINSKENTIKEIKKGNLFIATSNDIIVATLTLDNDTIKGFYVEPIHMRKGIGSLFLDDIETKLKKKKINKIQLTCNKESIGFYKKRGFIVKKTIEDKKLKIKRYLLEKII